LLRRLVIFADGSFSGAAVFVSFATAASHG